MAKNKTLVVMVLDESGSMGFVKQQTISGFNEYVDSLRSKKDFKMALTQFNSDNLQVGKALAMKKAVTLDDKNYKPGGLTPLNDAIAKSILSAKKHEGPVLVVIMTDGAENASTDYSRDDVFKLIAEKKDDGWTFVFLGADQDAFLAGDGYGIPSGNTMSYNSRDTHRTMNVVSDQTMSYAERGSVPSNDFFIPEDDD